MSVDFATLLDERGFLLADGATGTNLFAVGLETGDSPELWNADKPDAIKGLYASFLDAGCDLFLTNSFGGNRRRLMLHQAADRAYELNKLAAGLAKEAIAESGRTALAAGSIGPTGDILEPIGALSSDEAAAAFAEQAKGLRDGGADVLWIETMSSLEELRAAVEGVSTAELPIVATMSFDTNGRTMMGLGPEQARQLSTELGVELAAFGANCGIGPAQLLATLLGFARFEGDAAPVVAKANCGIPEYVEGEIRYSGSLEIMADYAVLARDAGARVIGGCCGTTPAHVAAMRSALDDHPKGAEPSIAMIEAALGAIQTPDAEAKQPTRKRERRRRA